MKQASSLSWLLDRTMPWLHWWQELLLNWLASASNIGTIVVISADGETQGEWSLPSDLELQRSQLEDMLTLKRES